MSLQSLHKCLEVPVVVPSLERSPQWQYVERENDSDSDNGNGGGVWEPVQSPASSSTHSTHVLSTEELESYACITQVSNEVTVTCQVLPEAPHLFCTSRAATTGQAPLVTYYALPTELQTQVIASALHVLDIGSEIRIVLVQDSGTVWFWQVKAMTLEPVSNITRTEMAKALPQNHDNNNNNSSSLFWLRRSAIAFLNPSVLCVAWTPFLIAMDFTTKQAAVWSSSVTLQAMKARQSTITNLVFTSFNYLAGNTQMIQDMSAILTLTTSHVATSGQVVVYSWHDDGILRQWILPANSWQEPVAVYEYDLATDNEAPLLPLTTLEGARLQATTIAEGNWTLAVYPTNTTTDTSPNNNVNKNETGNNDDMLLPQVYLVQGKGVAMEERKQYITPQEPLVVVPRATPSAESQLVAWQWTTNIELQTLWKSRDEQWGQWTYSANHQDWQPIAETKGWWDGVDEERALAWLDVLSTATNFTTPEDAWHAIDQAYLKFLLRPRCVRGTGSVLPPAPQVIRQALTELTGAAASSSSQSIGVQVVLALHAWRKAQQAQKHERNTLMTPSQHHGRRQAPNKTPKQYYESLQREMAQQAAAMVAEVEPASPAAVPTLPPVPAMGLAQQVQAHVDCWQQLLQRIYQLEESARAVLCVCWTNPSSSSQQDAAVVVRGQAVSVVARAGPQPTDHGVLGILDNAAIRLVLYADDHPTYAKALASMEEGLVQDLIKGDLALRPAECLDDLEAGLSVFDDNPLWNERILLPADANGLVKGFRDPDISIEEHVREIGRLPIGYRLLGLNLLPLDSCQETPFDRDISADLDNVHWRLSSSSLIMRCLDSYRRLMLGRYMVLNFLGVRKEVSKAAMWGYIQSLSLMVTCAQQVPLPLAMTTHRFAQLDFHPDDSTSPPKKRPSIDNHVPSLLEQALGVTEKTTALDAFLIGVTRANFGGHASPSMLSFPVLVTKAVFTGLYMPTRQSSDQSFLPELTLLKSCINEVMDYPSYVLWLLSPAFAMKDDLREQRRSVLAQCLLRLAEDEADEAQGIAMAERAFELMRFNPHEIDQGVDRITKLHRYVGSQSRFLLNVLHLAERAVRECTNYYTEDAWENEKLRQVLLMYFSAALGARQWKTAATAAIMQPDPVSRSEDLKRLVRHMVDNGAVADLVQMCASTEDEMSVPRLEGIDLYATAMACLGGMASSDAYLHAVDNKEPISDYQGALFALHVANNQWKRAAESLDLRCVHARRALSHETNVVSGERARARERLAVEDLALSAAGRAIAMSHVQDEKDKYLVSGEPGTYATLPLKLLDSPSSRAKRARSMLPDGKATDESEMDRLDCFMRGVDIDLASARSLCFQTLNKAGKVGPKEAKAFLKEPPSLKTDQLLISELFKNGFYHYGLMMGKALRAAQKGHYMGIDVFHDIASHLACNFLVPLMLGKEAFPKPNIEQLYASLHAIAPGEAPRLPSFAKSLKALDAGSTCIRQLASEILRHVTIAHTTAATPLAHEVVRCLLSEHGPAALPEWLHDLMVHGTASDSNDAPAPGLFAKRSNGAQSFMGDPSALLTKYTHAGMYEEACRTVNETLALQISSTAAQRLPEKGDMDFVPYPKIDMLYNLIDVSIGKGRYSQDQVTRLKKSQKEMEASLERHFELLEISEMGLKSARAMQLS